MYHSYLVSFRAKSLNNSVSLDMYVLSSRNIQSLPLFNKVFFYVHKTVKIIELKGFNLICSLNNL